MIFLFFTNQCSRLESKMQILTTCRNTECGNALKKEFQDQIGLCVVCDGKVATNNTTCSKDDCNNFLKKEFQGQVGLCVVCDGKVAKPARIATHNTRTCSKDGCKNLLKICYPTNATKCRLHKTYINYKILNVF